MGSTRPRAHAVSRSGTHQASRTLPSLSRKTKGVEIKCNGLETFGLSMWVLLLVFFLVLVRKGRLTLTTDSGFLLRELYSDCPEQLLSQSGTILSVTSKVKTEESYIFANE